MKTEIIYFFKKLYEQGAITLYEGNISVKQDGRILMTPSQQSKETLSEEMIVEMDEGGQVLSDNGFAPSSEYRMHLQLYHLRDDIKAVVHTHSPYATAFALKGLPIRSDLIELELFFGGEIPCCAYGRPGTDEVFRDFTEYFVEENKNAVLLERHGLTTVGSSVEEAFARAQTVEKIAKITRLSYGL